MVDYTAAATYPNANIAGDMRQGGLQLTCILYDGVPTVTAGTYGPDGYKDDGIALSAAMGKDYWVTLDVQVENTWDNTKGLPVVKPITAGTLIIGQIITEPTWVNVPATTAAADTWAKILAGGYYRMATVWFPGVTSAMKCQLVNDTTAIIVPGVQATIDLDASATVALQATAVPVKLSAQDIAAGGVGMFSFHYVASGTGTQYVLVGFTGGTVLIEA